MSKENPAPGVDPARYDPAFPAKDPISILWTSTAACLADPLWLLQISRPGLWAITIWLYMFPHQLRFPYDSIPFWVGLIYMTFPINLWVYTMNDIVDTEKDLRNPRKGNYIFGAKGTFQEYLRVVPAVLLFQLLCFAFLLYYGDSYMIYYLIGFIIFNQLYDLPSPYGFREIPPLELVNQGAYFLCVAISCSLSNRPYPPTVAFLFSLFFALKAQIAGEIADWEADKKAGRRTTVTEVGPQLGSLILLLCLGAEVYILVIYFAEWLMAIGLTGAFLIVSVDLFLLPGIFIPLFNTITLMAPLTILYVWATGCFTFERLEIAKMVWDKALVYPCPYSFLELTPYYYSGSWF